MGQRDNSQPRSLPAAPRPPEPAAGSTTAPAAEVRSPRASCRGDGDRAGGPACRAGAAGLEGRLLLPRLAPGHCEPSPGPLRSLPRWLARSLPRRLPGPVPPSLSFSSLLPSLCPEAGLILGPARGGSKLRRGSWAAAVGVRCGVRGDLRSLGMKLSRAAGQPPLPTAALGLFLGRGLKGVSSLVPENLPSATPN